jgi:hypothetical protein
MAEGEGGQECPPAARRWAQGLAAAVVILAALGLLQHRLPRADRIPFGSGFAEDSYRQYPESQWADASEPGAQTAARRLGTSPAAPAPVRPAPEVAAPQGPWPALGSAPSTGRGWFATGNEQDLAGAGADQEGLASRVAPMPAEEGEPVPRREPGYRPGGDGATGAGRAER